MSGPWEQYQTGPWTRYPQPEQAAARPQEKSGFFSNLGSLLVEGGKRAIGAAEISPSVITGGVGRDQAAKVAAELSRPPSVQPKELKEAQEAFKDEAEAFAQAEGFVESAGPVGQMLLEFGKQVLTNPKGAVYLTAQSAANMVPAIVGMLGGAKAGAPFGPKGVIVGGLAGGFAGQAPLEIGMEFVGRVGEELQTRGLPPTEANVAKIFADEKLLEQLISDARTKGATTAAIDAAFTLGAGRFATAPGRNALQAAAKELGTSATPAQIAARAEQLLGARTVTQKVARGAGAVGIDVAGGGLSEAGGQAAAYGEVDLSDVGLEMLGELGGAAIEIPAAARALRTPRPISGPVEEDTERPGAAPVPPEPPAPEVATLPPTPEVAPRITERDIAAAGVDVPAGAIPFVRRMVLGKTREEIGELVAQRPELIQGEAPTARIIRSILGSQPAVDRRPTEPGVGLPSGVTRQPDAAVPAAAPAVEPLERDGVAPGEPPVGVQPELTRPITPSVTEIPRGPQAPQAVETEAQRPQVPAEVDVQVPTETPTDAGAEGGLSPAGTTAESVEAPGPSLKSSWDSMPVADRETMALLAGIRQIPATNASQKTWDALTEPQRKKLAEVMAVETAPVATLPEATAEQDQQPLPEPDVTEDQKEVENLERQRNRAKAASPNLRTALIGSLPPNEVRDISPDFSMRPLQAQQGKAATSLSTKVADGALNEFLPFNLRFGDGYTTDPTLTGDAVEYIKDKLRNKQHYTYETDVAVEQIGLQIAEIERAMREHLNLRETNLMIQEAIDEQRRIDEEAEVAAPEAEARTPAPAPRVAEEEITAEEEARLEREAIQAESREAEERLSPTTPAALKAAEERAKKAEAEAEQARKDADKAEAEAKKELERREIAERSEGAARDFQLGQTAEDNLTGQRNIFGEQQQREGEPTSRSGAEKFASEEIDKIRRPDYKGRQRLNEMRIDDFLALADEVTGSAVESEKVRNTTRIMREGGKFSSLPFLQFDRDGQITGHEGRHRAMALKALGYETMPVVLWSSNIRWDQQVNPDSFDYVENWPTELKAQSRAADPNFTMPFPVPREQAGAPYTPDIFGEQQQREGDTGNILEARTAQGGWSIDTEEQRVEQELTGKSFTELMQWAVDNAPNEYQKEIAQKVQSKLKAMQKRGVEMTFDLQTGMNRLLKMSNSRGILAWTASQDKPVSLTLTLNGAASIENQSGYPPGMRYSTVLHELVHAATVLDLALNKNSLPAKALNDLRNKVVDYFNDRVKNGTLTDFEQKIYDRTNNALTSTDEVLAWGLTDNEMQTFLADVKIGERTLWDRFVDIVRNILGMDRPYKSALEELLRTADSLLDISVDETARAVTEKGYQFGPATPTLSATASPMTQGTLFERLEDLARGPSVYGEGQKRSPSFKREVTQLQKRLDRGEITAEEFAARVEMALKADDAARMAKDPKPRERGADYIRQRLLEAKRRGDLSERAVDMAEWFILKNPALVEDLAVSISGAKGDASGNYDSLRRLMTLMKESSVDSTTVHEILHHLERMMPPKVQAKIRQDWLSGLMKADPKTDQEKLYFHALKQYHVEDMVLSINNVPKELLKVYEQALKEIGNKASVRGDTLARHLLTRGDVAYDNYQYTNPSEFWAVNATRIAERRFEASSSVLGLIKNWLRELAQKAKSVFGLQSDATIIRALDSLIKGDGKFQSQQMLMEGVSYENLSPEQQQAALDRQANIERTPGELARRNVFMDSVEATWESPVDPRPLGISDYLIYQLQNKQIDLKRVQDAIGNLGYNADGYLKESLYHGRAAKRTEQFLEKGLDPILEAMRKNGITQEQIGEYLHNRHAPEANAHIAERNERFPDGGSGITNAEAQAYMDGLEPARKRQFEQVASLIDKSIRDMQDILVESGNEEASTIQTWREMFQYYIPLVRADADYSVNKAMSQGSGYSMSGKFSKARTGSTKEVKQSELLAAIAEQHERAIVRAERNRVGQAIFAMALQNPNPSFYLALDPETNPIWRQLKEIRELQADRNFMQEIIDSGTLSPDLRAAYEMEIDLLDEMIKKARVPALRAEEQARKDLQSMGLDPELVNNIMMPPMKARYDANKNEVVYEPQAAFANDHVFTTRVNGKDKFVLFNANNERASRMVKSIKSMDAEPLSQAMNISARITRYFAAINTQYNPVFGVYNFLRDMQAAMLQISDTPIAGKRAAVMGNTMPAMRAIFEATRGKRSKKDLSKSDREMVKLWDEFTDRGGQTGFRDLFSQTSERADAIQRMIDPSSWANSPMGKFFTANGTLKAPFETARKGLAPVFDLLSDYNTTMENAVRLAAYKVAKEQFISEGMGKEEAMDRAASIGKELTVNFNRKGALSTQVGALYAFFNAAVQGTTRMAQTLTGPAGKTIVGGAFLLGALQAVMLAAAGFDDEEPPEFVKQRNYVIPIGDGKYLAFPMPLGFNVLPTISRIVTEGVLSGGENIPDKIVNLLDAVMDMYNPIGNAGMSMQTVAPTLLDPAVALFENKDWTGKKISREDFSGIDPTPGYTRSKDASTFLSKELARFLNFATGGTGARPGVISPTADQLDYLVGQLTGGVGRETMKLGKTIEAQITGEELPFYSVPLFGRFYGNVNEMAAISNAFYRNLTDLNIHRREVDNLRKDRGNVQEYISKNPEARMSQIAGTQYREIQKMRKTRLELLERGEKEKAKRLEEQIKTRMVRFNEKYRELKD